MYRVRIVCAGYLYAAIPKWLNFIQSITLKLVSFRPLSEFDVTDLLCSVPTHHKIKIDKFAQLYRIVRVCFFVHLNLNKQHAFKPNI